MAPSSICSCGVSLMSDHVLVDLFVEGRAHEELLRPLVARVAREEKTDVRIRVRVARGGHVRAIGEFRLYQHFVNSASLNQSSADLIVVGIDGNCSRFADARSAIRRETVPELVDRTVVACPDPHIERWYLADPDSFETVVGDRPQVGRRKCVRDYYKQLLARAIRQGGHPPTLGGIEFASELVAAMDLYRAGKTSASLKAFVDDLRTGLRRICQAGA